MQAYDKTRIRIVFGWVYMVTGEERLENDSRKIGRDGVQVRLFRQWQIKKRMLFAAWVLMLTILALHIRDIDARMKQMQILLRRIELPQYEAVQTAGEAPQEADYVSSIGSIGTLNVERPIQRTWTETLLRLDDLGQTDPVIARICENRNLYPEKMLAALANNPEMADYVAGYAGKREKAACRLTDAEKKQEFPLLLQWDPRWGYQAYGSDSYIGVSGCGPTCLAMVLYSLTGEESLTPDRIAAYAIENGYYVEGTGTAWALMKDFPRFFGVKITEFEKSEEALTEELDRGHILICAMGEGEFTVAGHFIVIYGYDESGFMVNDPNCVARSRKRWTYEEIGGQIKHVWGYGI